MLPSFIPLSKKKLGDEKFYDKDYIVKIYALFSNTSITTHTTHTFRHFLCYTLKGRGSTFFVTRLKGEEAWKHTHTHCGPY